VPSLASRLRSLAAVAVLGAVPVVTGCAGRGPVQTSADYALSTRVPGTPEGQSTDQSAGPATERSYAVLFAAARDTLLARGFVLDRVDAAAGIITTQPRATAGLATPWDAEQVGFDQELSDLGNPNERRVTVRFRSRDPDTLGVEVDAFIDRVRRPGWRVETESISRSRYISDPALIARRMEPVYRTPVTRDDRLASVLLTEMLGRAMPEPKAQ
jgi:hypothetical protein